MGQASPSLTPRVTRLFQAKANVASSRAPMPTGTIRRLQDMLLTTTTSDRRRVKRAGQMHCDRCQPRSDGGGPRRWAAQFHNQQSNERGDKMTADKGA